MDNARADNRAARSTYMHLYCNHLHNTALYNNMKYTSKTGAAHIAYNTLTPLYQQTIAAKENTYGNAMETQPFNWCSLETSSSSNQLN